MLRQGASLPEIAQVLRHREIKTTAIYAKVDRTQTPGAREAMAGERVMTDLRWAMNDYLTVRRQLGFELKEPGRRLEHFVSFMERAGAPSTSPASSR